MSTQSKSAARWDAEGKEAETLLQLARSAPLPQARDERAAEARFLSSFLEQARTSRERRGGKARRALWQYAIAASFVLALGAGVFRLGMHFHDEPLSYRVKSGEVLARFIHAEREPVELDFSDGTVVTVSSGTSARVTEITRRGARFLLESGRMDFDVVPHPDRGRWEVAAGPYQVHVTGTIFSVSWGDAEGLQVEVTRGHVIVEGVGQRRELGPGDSFHHREPVAQAPSSDSSALDVSREPMDPELRVENDLGQAGSMSKPLGSASSARVREPSWGQLVASGDFNRVIEAATQRGIQSCLDGCGRVDLRALADAARLGGRLSLAQQALSAQRARFPASADALAAAFLLGRLAEDRGDSSATAWYDIYLAEAPTGRFAGDALGRKMMIVATSDQRRALLLARQYRARFPSGPYAAHAKSLLDAAGGE